MKLEKVVLVTGGDKGIGRAIVEKLSQTFKKVIFTYNTNLEGAKLVAEKLENVTYFQCDLKSRELTNSVVSEVLERFGAVDILVNNAACDSDALVAKMTHEAWDDVIDVNLKALFNLVHPIVTPMGDKGWGRIVNLTSIAAVTGAFGKSNYAASKAGVIGFTKSLALEMARKGVTVNAIAPGAIETDMLMRIPEKYRSKILDGIPSRRFGKPEEVASLVAFLVSDQASYINGQVIHINGGSY